MLDLHGYTVNDAFKKFNETVDHFYHAQYKKLTAITGHGEISKEIQTWAENNQYIRSIERQASGSVGVKIPHLRAGKDRRP